MILAIKRRREVISWQKTIVTLDRKLVNYDNIVSISVEYGTYSDDNGEENDAYGLIAFDVANSMHVLGVFGSRARAAKAENKLKKWLECETFGVYDFDTEGDD